MSHAVPCSFSKCAAFFLIAFSLVFAQGTAFANSGDGFVAIEPANVPISGSGEVDLPYEPGIILIQYDEQLFRDAVNGQGEGAAAADAADEGSDGSDAGVAPMEIAEKFLKANGVANPRVVQRIESMHVEVVDIGKGVDPLMVIRKLKLAPVDGIRLVQPNLVYRPMQVSGSTEADPRRNEAWHLKAIQVKDAWDVVAANLPATPPAVTIGIVDDGVDFNELELSDAKWDPSSCKDENGDEVIGGCPNGGYSVLGDDIHDSDPAPSRGDTHGTAVAFVAAGKYNNGISAAGVAQDVQIAAIRAATSNVFFYLLYGEFIRDVDIIDAIDFARENDIGVLNFSWGAYMNPSTCHDFKYTDPAGTNERSEFLVYQALEEYGRSTQSWNGGVVVAAMGNKYEEAGGGVGKRIIFPADFSSDVKVQDEADFCWRGLENVISVGGTERAQDGSEKIFEFFVSPGQRLLDGDGNPVGTTYGNHIDVAAPSRSIPIGRASNPAEGQDGWQDAFHGTSYATPQVVGVIALMLRVNPDLTPAQIKEKIRNSADRVDALTQANLAEGRRLNAYRAVVAALGEETEQLDTLPNIPSAGGDTNYITVSRPARPSAIASAPGNGKIAVSWSKVHNAERYEIRWRVEGDGTTLTSWEDAGTRTEYTIVGLDNNERHTVQVRGVNAAGNGDAVIIDFSEATTPVPSVSPASLDFDGSGAYDAAKDGLFLYLYTETEALAANLAAYVHDGTATTAADAAAEIDAAKGGSSSPLDFDGSGAYDAAKDGLFLYLYTETEALPANLAAYVHDGTSATALAAAAAVKALR